MATTRRALLKLNKILYKLLIKVDFKDDVAGVEYLPTPNGGATIYTEFPTYRNYLLGNAKLDSFLIRTIAHELGHYLVSPPMRRRQKDYGVKNKNLKYSAKVNDKYELEEIKARAIEFEIYDKLGFKYRNGKDYRNSIFVKKWWQSQGKSLVDNLFYILGP